MIGLWFFFFAYIIVANSGTVSYLRGVPRLGNISYWDYYFICTSIGQTQQWSVNNSALGEFSLGVAQVLSNTNSEFSYITSLLSRKQTPSGDLEHISLLIVSCEDSCYLEVLCSNGSFSMPANNAESRTGLNDRENGTSVFLDYILTQYILGTDTPEYLSIFVCGVENMFLTWQVDAFEPLAFITRDPFGQSRRTLQENGTTVKQQGISIGNKPYPLVTILIVIHSEVLNVMCGYSRNEVSLMTIEQLTMQSTLPSNPSENPLTTTTENGSEVNVAAATAIPVILIVVAAIIITILVVFIIIWRKKKIAAKSDSNGLPHDDNIPIRKVYMLKTPKSRQKNVNYKVYCEKIHYIFSIVSSNVFDAAKIYVNAPDTEKDALCIIKLDDDGHIYIGMIGNTPVGLIKHKTGQTCVKTVGDIITEWFPNAVYLISVGLCYAFESKNVSLGDVFVSESIIKYNETIEEQNGKDLSIRVRKIEMDKDILEIFSGNIANEVEGLKIANSGRHAKHFAGSIASGPEIRDNDHLKSIASTNDNTLGVERVAGYLLDLQTEGFSIEKRKMQVIAIKAVFGFVGEKGRKDWKFQAGQAAFFYISETIKALKTS